MGLATRDFAMSKLGMLSRLVSPYLLGNENLLNAVPSMQRNSAARAANYCRGNDVIPICRSTTEDFLRPHRLSIGHIGLGRWGRAFSAGAARLITTELVSVLILAVALAGGLLLWGFAQRPR